MNHKNLCDRLEICADQFEDLKLRAMAATVREAIEELEKKEEPGK